MSGALTLKMAPDAYVVKNGEVDPVAMARPYLGVDTGIGRNGRVGHGRPFVFLDLAGDKAAAETPVGRMGYNDIGRRVVESADHGWLNEYAEALAYWFGGILGDWVLPLIVFRYPTGCYGTRTPDGRRHSAHSAMMSAPWLDGPHAAHSVPAMVRLAAKAESAALRWGVWVGVAPIDDRFRWWNARGLADMLVFLKALGCEWAGLDYISGGESVSGKPPGANWQDEKRPWPMGGKFDTAPLNDPMTKIPVPPRRESVADHFIAEVVKLAGGVSKLMALAVESGREAGRPMYEVAGNLRMVMPESQRDGGDRWSTGEKDIERLRAECWRREVLNPGVPQYNLFDGDWTGRAEEFRAAAAVLRSMNGRQEIGATCWAVAQAGGPHPMAF